MARKPEIGNVQLYPDRTLQASDRNGYVLKFYCPLREQRIRKSCGTRDRREAGRILRECRERLLNGAYVQSNGAITAQDELAQAPERHRVANSVAAGEVTWEAAFEIYHRQQECRLRTKSHVDYRSRLELADRVLSEQRRRFKGNAPLLLTDALSLTSLEALQQALLDGSASRLKRRSPHTVNSVLQAVLTFARFCRDHEWIANVPPLKTIPVDEVMKGRPITGEEFDRMLDATPAVVGARAAAGWQFVLKVLWESGFRVSDIMDFSWDDPRHIHPVWPKRSGQHATIVIPSSQKNGKCEEIPMLPGLRQLLDEVPKRERVDWVVDPPAVEYEITSQGDWFRPTRSDLMELIQAYSNSAIARACDVSETTVRKWMQRLKIERESNGRIVGIEIPSAIVQRIRGRAAATTRHALRLKGRMTVERVSRLICEIGKKANVIVRRSDKRTGQKTKFASAHDLRRSCAERLINAGVSAETLKVVFRHRDFATTEKYYGARRKAQSAGEELHRMLNVVAPVVSGQKDEAIRLDPEQIKKLKALLAAV